MRQVSTAVALAALTALALAGCDGGSQKPRGSQKTVAQRIAAAQKETDAELRTARLIRIAQDQFKGSDTTGAEQTLRTVALDCKEISDPFGRARRLADLAMVYGGMKNYDGARAALQSGREAVDKIEEPAVKAEGLVAIAQGQAAANDAAGAEETLKSAEEMSGQLKDEEGKPAAVAQTGLLASIAAAYAAMGRSEASQRRFEEAQKLADSLQGKHRADALVPFALAKHSLDRKDEAKKLLDAAAEAANKESDGYLSSSSLAEVAETFARLGETARAKAVFKQAEDATLKIGDAAIQSSTLQGVRMRLGKALKGAK